MKRWKEEIVEALKLLGGTGSYQEIYDRIQQMSTRTLTREWKATVRREIENHSSSSDNYRGGEDLFVSVNGIGKGVWGLREKLDAPNPKSVDFEDVSEIDRVKQDTYRIIRDTFLSRCIKLLYKNSCQVCGKSISLRGGSYAEAHHIKPLGRPHNGPDIAGNILVVCPNHHVMFDYGAISLDIHKLTLHPEHKIDMEFVRYYNDHIFRAE